MQNLENAPNPWTTLTQTVVYDNAWITVQHRDVLNPAGGKGIYGIVHFKNLAIGVIALDDDLNTWLVGQYRYALEAYSWEIPEGGGQLDTSALDSAQRELKEETGITATHWTPVINLHLSNSVSDEAGIVFVAQGLTFGESEPEETEQLVVRKMPFHDAFEMVMRGEITDALAVAGILKVKIMLDSGMLPQKP